MAIKRNVVDPRPGNQRPTETEIPRVLKGTWVTTYNLFIRQGPRSAPVRPVLGADHRPAAVLGVFHLSGAGTLTGNLKRLKAGYLPAEDFSVTGSYTVQQNEELSVLEGTMTLNLPDPARVSPLDRSTVSHILRFIVRGEDTIDWILHDGTDTDFYASDTGTMHRVKQFRPDMRGTWATDYTGFVRPPGSDPASEILDNYALGSVLVVLKLGESGSLVGKLDLNLSGNLPGFRIDRITGSYSSALNNMGVWEGAIVMVVSETRTNTLHYVMRDRDIMDWMLTSTTDPGLFVVQSGTFSRVTISALPN